ncbi:MAG: glycosyltransferase [Flavobacteriaceae bacterium]|nr:glycosyltransferase [Flavobacteriaceae bacterium]
MIISVVFYIFVVCAAIQVLFYVSFLTVFSKFKTTVSSSEPLPISLIIFVKNGGEYLKKNLKNFINQEYSNFEILLVNNESSDNTDELLEEIVEKNKSIRVIDVKNNESFWGNKKYAYTLAIKAAKFEHLLFSEIYVRPKSKHWISEMSKLFTPEKTIILGYTKIKKESSFTNLLFRFDNVLLHLKSFVFTKFKTPFTASSYNYAFTKKEFFRVKGFINHIKIREGKEDLFIRDANEKGNVTFTISKQSFIETLTNESFSKWYSTKRNSNVLKKNYTLKNRIFLNIFSLTKFLFYFLSILLFIYYPWHIILAIFGFYLILQYTVIDIATKALKESLLIIFLPILEISLVLIQISLFFANLVSKPNTTWK